MPLFTVIIPLYNKEPHIKRAIDSVLAQTVQDFELVIVDDGSTDNGPEVVKSFRNSKIIMIRQKNSGVSAARNRGIKEARANLIAFLDADDEWSPLFLETVLRLHEKYPEAGAYATAYNFYLPDEKIRIAKFKAIPPSPWEGLLPSYFLAEVLGEHPLCSSSICILKQVFPTVGSFRAGAWWGEDDDMWGRICVKYPIAFSWEICSTIHRDATNRACSRLQAVEHPFIKTAQKLMSEGKVPENMINDLKECIAKYQIISATQNIFTGNPKIARNILLSCKTKLLNRQKFFLIILSLLPSSTLFALSKMKRNFFKLLS